jgi:hypothetical protein
MTELLAFEWRRMRSLRGTWVLLALVVGFALLADLAVGLGRLGEPLDAEDLAVHVVQRDLVVRWRSRDAARCWRARPSPPRC